MLCVMHDIISYIYMAPLLRTAISIGRRWRIFLFFFFKGRQFLGKGVMGRRMFRSWEGSVDKMPPQYRTSRRACMTRE